MPLKANRKVALSLAAKRNGRYQISIRLNWNR